MLAALDEPVEGVAVGDGQREARGGGAPGAHVELDGAEGARVETRVSVQDQQPGCPEEAGSGVHLERAPRAASHDCSAAAPGRAHGFVQRAPVDDQHLGAQVEVREVTEEVGKCVRFVEGGDDDPEFSGLRCQRSLSVQMPVDAVRKKCPAVHRSRLANPGSPRESRTTKARGAGASEAQLDTWLAGFQSGVHWRITHTANTRRRDLPRRRRLIANDRRRTGGVGRNRLTSGRSGVRVYRRYGMGVYRSAEMSRFAAGPTE